MFGLEGGPANRIVPPRGAWARERNVALKLRSRNHSAANADVAEPIKKPFEYFRNQVAGTSKLPDRVGYIGFFSTCSTYTGPRRISIAEDPVQDPISRYLESNRETLFHWQWRRLLLRWSLHRFNPGGADAKEERGEERPES